MNKLFVCCAIIVDDQNKFLLIRRANQPFLGRWSFISGIGASKKGLTPDQAVIGEVEYDIGARFEGMLRFSYQLPDDDPGNEVFAYVGSVDKANIRLNPKAATEYGWFSLDEINRLGELAFDNRWMLDKIYAN